MKLSIAALAAALILTGCGGPGNPDVVKGDVPGTYDAVTVVYVNVGDDHVVPCVVYKSGYAGGIDCIGELTD